LPVVGLNFPAMHTEHNPPLGPVYPVLQTQLAFAVDAAGDCVNCGHPWQLVVNDAPGVGLYLPASQFKQELSNVAPVVVRYLPALQSVHTAAPVVVLYFPAAHAAQFPPLGPVNPTLQTQLVCAVDPAADCAFDGQFVQVLDAVAPTAAEYVLAPQSVHTAAPVVVLYFPAAQAEQAPAGPV